MPEEPTDPRHRGFAGFSLRPKETPSEEPTQGPARRGIGGPPPPKPPPARVPAEADQEEPAAPEPEPDPAQPADEEPDRGSGGGTATATKARPRRSKEQGSARPTLGTPRHHMRYVQFQVGPAISESLTRRAEEEDLVLGEVVMDALKSFEGRPPTGPSMRRRRRSATAVRRSVLVRPSEAEEVKAMADRRGCTPSALIRMALEAYLVPSGTGDTPRR